MTYQNLQTLSADHILKIPVSEIIDSYPADAIQRRKDQFYKMVKLNPMMFMVVDDSFHKAWLHLSDALDEIQTRDLGGVDVL